MSPDSDQPAGNEWRPKNCPAGCHTVVGRIPQVAAHLPFLSQRKQGRGRERERQKNRQTHKQLSDPAFHVTGSFLLLYFEYISEPVLYYFYLSKEVESVLPLLPESLFNTSICTST